MGLQKYAINGWTYIIWALLILLLPLRWVLGFALAAGFHELCHVGMIILLKGSIHSVRVKPTGICMGVSGLTFGQELLCALSGPMGGLFLVSFVRIFPEMALVALGQSLFNLLPIYPLDGGRALRCAYYLGKEKYLAKKGLKRYNRDTIYKEV